MKEFWRVRSHLILVPLICFLYIQNLSSCWSLNDEGVALLRFKERVVSDPYGALSNWNGEAGVENPCAWFGVKCSDGYVVVLNLKNLCLTGTLAPDLGFLVHVKSILLRNNSFSGIIPEEITKLEELEVLDLGYNNFSGKLQSYFLNKSISIFLSDNNELLSKHSEIQDLQELSEIRVDEDLLYRVGRSSFCNSKLIPRSLGQKAEVVPRKFLQEAPVRRRTPPRRFLPPPFTRRNSSRNASSPPPAPSDPPAPSPLPRSKLPTNASSPPPTPIPPAPAPMLPPSAEPMTPPLSRPPAAETPSSSSIPRESPGSPSKSSGPRHRRVLILSAAIGGPLLLLFFIIGILYCQRSRVATVKPWATGLSGQLQRAFVTGVPILKRSELETACEDFSNVIGTSANCTLYKGTLSSGVEIAVASLAVASQKDWSHTLEAHFRKKIDELSKVNHKNFVNLIGYCEEDEPFSRMMVFEYAPNGTLFEHLHIREAEHLDWGMRLRIAMGIAYCLEYMHQLSPAIAHTTLTTSAVYLTEDYAAKVSDFHFSDEGNSNRTELSPQNDVYNFGVVLFEMITGKLPYSVGNGAVEDWASDYVNSVQSIGEMVDPTLDSFQQDQLDQIAGVIKSCVNPNPRQRPTMREVVIQLREITAIGPDGAIPKLSPLWWAELEILSTETN